MKIGYFRSNRNYRYKRIGIHNIFKLDIYNRNWLLDVVTATLEIKNDICLSSRQILRFLLQEDVFYVYLSIH